MAKKGKGARIQVTMKSTESSHRYLTEKNRRNNTSRLELRKFDPVLRRHVIYRESR
ncbi:MAG: 50S ribosomal protein L33 [Caldilineaceae bacterium]|uniref:Large ribosomal subunit protein bL33 n=1 Tax=Caldilineaceae bacterium SB0662_bin_9 TaxID=2605258 RepID=A0A6B1DP63_9CHLR|nr:50S ribosomal protein L33 [Caldilineaceae bacterium]MXZ25791.1 50S ribosomal protein L33 [Caldilineaceae bacterium SB0665_bin_21]MYA05338.1 50S ribosomal protein L33 [Caldilineaceae bacterium SB0664_bin_22]MYC62024.1 50S ribosomal protein L33 [Caldilineaceae bacterium SB0661_bin_34]MYD89087.1 50S ribosomal protein L33 [Caldilineaceae bacterium SB0662_bin_9]